jgi:hypothetical protein
LSFTFSADAQTVDELPDYESLDELNGDQKLDNVLPEDSTFALIFRSPTKSTSRTHSNSPAKVDYPTLPDSVQEGEESLGHVMSEYLAVTGPTMESVVAEVVANVPTSTYILDNEQRQDEEAANTSSIAETAEHTIDIAYPALPSESTLDNQSSPDQSEHTEHGVSEEEDADISEIQLGTYTASVRESTETKLETTVNPSHNDSEDEEFTEASMQLDIQEDYEREGDLASSQPTEEPAGTEAHDITDGLTLSLTPAKAAPTEHTPKKLHSPPPPLRIETGPDDATMTMAIDDDTAILKSFLSRAAASKAERAAVITRRESLENRRDSDIVRHALASPRKALEEKDPNSPTKIDSEMTLGLSATPVLSAEKNDAASPNSELPEADQPAEAKGGRGSRRSSREKKSRLPAPATATQPQTSKIAIRRADGTDPVVLKKTDAQELALITRNNTRKNKQGAFVVNLRLLKLQAEAILSPQADLDETPREPVPGKKSLRWDETLAYYQEHADTIAAQLAEAESLATPDELSLPAPSSGIPSTKKPRVKTSTDKNSTPKIRRVRGLGTANGTPGKGLLGTTSLLPEVVQEEKATATTQPPPQSTSTSKSIPKPKSTSRQPKLSIASEPTPDTKLASLDITPVGIVESSSAQQRSKSRIAAPRTIKMPKSVSSTALAAEKENARSTTGISGATPRKGIPAPKVVASSGGKAGVASMVGVGGGAGGESGLPRRRGRRV